MTRIDLRAKVPGMIKRKSNGSSPGRIIGERNRDLVDKFMRAHVGATNQECSHALGISAIAVGRHVATLKAEWKTKPGKRKSK